ncbi:bacterial regulatory protein, gntR family domain-containing protein [Ditylenchus destructor]|nr:bacterial regulatory protein, gntR family domain-containing protein [Ditylenchus destructor]
MDTSTASAGLSAPSSANVAPVVLSRNASQPLAQQLAQRFAARIQQRLLLPGARLPSVRDCARHHGVSPYTVVAAYDQLLAQGLLEARKKRGFFVRETRALPTRTPFAPTEAPAPLPPPVDASALIRGMFQADARRSPGLGTLPAEWLDLALLQSTLRRLAAQADDALLSGYGEPLGDERLRRALSRRLLDIAVQAGPEQIMSTVGATHGLDLITRSFLSPGDAVLVDDPGWAIEYARLSQAGMRLLPVPRGAHGPDIAVMRRLIEEHRPRMYVRCAAAGARARSPDRRGRHLRPVRAESRATSGGAGPAATHDLRLGLLEDAVAGLAGGLRRGQPGSHGAADGAQAGGLAHDQSADGSRGRAVPGARPVAQARRAHRLAAGGGAPALRAAGRVGGLPLRLDAPGLFGWVEVGVDTERLAPMMMDQGWLIAPGILFSPTRTPGTLMRINFATSQDPKFLASLGEDPGSGARGDAALKRADQLAQEGQARPIHAQRRQRGGRRCRMAQTPRRIATLQKVERVLERLGAGAELPQPLTYPFRRRAVVEPKRRLAKPARSSTPRDQARMEPPRRPQRFQHASARVGNADPVEQHLSNLPRTRQTRVRCRRIFRAAGPQACRGEQQPVHASIGKASSRERSGKRRRSGSLISALTSSNDRSSNDSCGGASSTGEAMARSCGGKPNMGLLNEGAYVPQPRWRFLGSRTIDVVREPSTSWW